MLHDLIYSVRNSDSLQLTQEPFLSTLAFVSCVVVAYLFLYLEPATLELVNSKNKLEFSNVRVKSNFIRNAYTIIMERFNNAPGKPFRVNADIGEVIILPPEYAHEIRNDERFSFTKAAFQWFYSQLPGMEGFRAGTNETHLMKLVSRHQLTHQLMKVTKPVSEECVHALGHIYTNNEEWHELVIKEANLQFLARVTSRIFLGEELCRDPDWLRITSMYSVIAFRAVEELRWWPSLLRPIVLWFLPNCTAARATVAEARVVIDPILQKRRAAKAEAAAKGETLEINDAISWLEDLAREKSVEYDPAAAQLSLSTAAIHSSSDFFTQVMLDIANDQQLIDALRAEIVSVLGNGTWNKNSLYNLKLMDSVMKESQRLKPIAVASMRRYTEEDITLADGVKIPRHSMTLVSAHRHWDEKCYENANEFDGYRFLRMRQQPGMENKAQFVSVSIDHMGFGFGLHACPGRFFASEEIKIALAHTLMGYDIKLVPGSDLTPRRFGFSLLSSPTAKIAVRKRKNVQTI